MYSCNPKLVPIWELLQLWPRSISFLIQPIPSEFYILLDYPSHYPLNFYINLLCILRLRYRLRWLHHSYLTLIGNLPRRRSGSPADIHNSSSFLWWAYLYGIIILRSGRSAVGGGNRLEFNGIRRGWEMGTVWRRIVKVIFSIGRGWPWIALI